MKKLRMFLVLVLCVTLSISVSHAKKYEFSVLAKKGIVKVKQSGKNWANIKTGAKLYSTDKVKLTGSAYLGLVHRTGKALQLKDAKEYSIKQLSGSVKSKSSVSGRFAKYIIDEMQGSDDLFGKSNVADQKGTTGSVTRAAVSQPGDLPFTTSSNKFRLNSPRKINLINSKMDFSWGDVENEDTYTVHIKDRFDRPITSKEVKGNKLEIDSKELGLDNDVYYFWYVSTTNSDKKYTSEDGCFLVYSENAASAINDSLNLLKNELGDLDNPVAQVVLAYFYEQNNLINEADAAYSQAINLSEGIDSYKKMHEKFLRRVNINR